MRLSTFNEYFDINNGLVVYNHLSKKFIKTRNNLLFKNVGDIKNEELLRCLYENGIIVSDDADENCLADLKLNDFIYDKALQLVLFPNEECNFRCVFCYEKFQSTFMDEDIKKDLLLYLRKYITQYSQLYIDWFGGEPLLSKEFIYDFSQKAIKICSEARIKYSAGMTTNGYLLDLETFKNLLNAKINNYHITLCGLKKEHDAVRFLSNKAGTFDRIVHNLKMIKQHIKSSTFKIIIRINVTQNTLLYLDALIRYLNDCFGGDDRFTFYYRPVGDWGGDSVKEITDKLGVTHTELFEKVMEISECLNYDIYYSLLQNNLCASTKRNNYSIRANGEICKCTESLYSDYNIIGKLSKKGEFEIDYMRLSRWLYTLNLTSKCQVCYKLPVCKNRKCPDNLLKEDTNKLNEYCGYDDISLAEIAYLLDKSNSKYILHVGVQ